MAVSLIRWQATAAFHDTPVAPHDRTEAKHDTPAAKHDTPTAKHDTPAIDSLAHDPFLHID
jgi:hypothetical protein